MRVLTLGVTNSGAHGSTVSTNLAKALGLPIEKRPCRTFSAPGSQGNAYEGYIAGPLILRFSEEVTFVLHGLRLLLHPTPLLLIGQDVLMTGRPKGEWNCTGVRASAPHEPHAGWLEFSRNHVLDKVTAHHYPRDGEPFFQARPGLGGVEGQYSYILGASVKPP